MTDRDVGTELLALETDIARGVYDDDLAWIETMVKRRRTALRAQATVHPGQRTIEEEGV